MRPPRPPRPPATARRILGLVLCLALVGLSRTARAEGDLERAKQLFKQAEIQFGVGRFEAARDLYLKAYELKPLPAFHFNIAQCHRNLGDYRQAIFHYKQYLARSKDAPNRDDVLELIRLCEEELTNAAARQAREHVTPGGDDGRSRGAGVASKGETPGETAPLDVPSPPSSAKPEAPIVQLTNGARGRVGQAWFWTGVSATAALLAVGTVTGIMALSKSSEFKDPKTPFGELQGLKDSGETLRTVANVSYVASATAAVATAVLFFLTDFGGPNERSVISAKLHRGGGMVLYRGQF